jgi:hypothetical protein
MDSKNLLSYSNILNDIKNFRKSGTTYGTIGDDFNKFDTPTHKYFKILFYFGSTSEFYDTDASSGLLAPTWEDFVTSNGTSTGKNDYYNYNSAWAFLKMNNEEERAEKLQKFITLLSDISTYSPWYFNTIEGISEAFDRKVAETGKLDLNESKKLTIGCVTDAFDNRISTLLDLYRDVTWSWIQKKEIIPANLRKFDMAVYIFETPSHKWHKNSDIIGSDNSSFTVSYKMLEFHDCEFGYNSIKSGFGELNNAEGFAPKFKIEISYGDCYEISYNDIMMRTIGDVILTDLINSTKNAADYESKPQSDNNSYKSELTSREYDNSSFRPEYLLKSDNTIYFGNLGERAGKQNDKINELQKYEYKQGFIATAAGQIAGHFVKDVKSLYNKALLGNLHTASLTQIGMQLEEAAAGNLIKTGMTVAQYAKNFKNNSNDKNKQLPNGNIYSYLETTKQKPSGDIYPAVEATKQKPIGDIYPNINIQKKKPIGNIFNKSTLANNI